MKKEDFKLFKNVVIWKIFGDWARKQIDCTPNGIKNGCKGICCKNKNFYPPNSFENSICGYLKQNGCSLDLNERPLICMLYPFKLNENNSLVIHGRALLSACKSNYKKNNITILENMSSMFVAVFGKDQYERVYKDLILHNKKESYFVPSEQILNVLECEKNRQLRNLIPLKRSEYFQTK